MPAQLRFRALFVVLVVECVGLGFLDLRADGPPPSEDDEKTSYGTELDTPLVGDYTNYAGMNPILIEGVGLVVNLRGTGGNPAPSVHRSALLDEMKRRGVRNPNGILQSPDTALVIVRAYLPPMMKAGETLDAEVVIPDSADAKSLEGGWLMETYLSEHAIGGARILEGHAFAKAHGPILVPGATGDVARSSNSIHLRKGRVLGGATILKKRELAIFLKNEYRSVRNATRIADAIGRRFHHFDEYGSQKPMADAVTDKKLVLDIHPRYKDNYPRYLQVIRHIAFRETPLNQRLRMQRLHEDLLVPEKADRAALELEAIGKDAIPILKTGLKSPLLECRFHAAMALAYLEEPSAIPVLAEAARDERAFRVFALAALSTLDDAHAHLALRALMSEPSAETRYGAFRALWTLDRNDPFILGEPMALDPDSPERKPKSQRGLWMLHVLDTQGEPMAHCTLRTRPEVVLFGADQKLTPPLALTVGPHILVTAQTGAETAVVSRFEPNRPDQRKEVSLQLADLLHAVDELGATYPDVVQMLMQTSKQNNLPGRFETDALPESGRVYVRPATNALPGRKATIGKEHLSPNLFPRFEADSSAANAEAQARNDDEASDTSGMASVPADKSASGKDSESDDKPRWFWNPFNRAKKSK